MDIILINTESVNWSEISGYTERLHPARQKAVEKKRNESDKINALLSRLLIVSEIKTRTGLPERRISFTRGSQGKPYLKDSDLQFSLSHTKGAVCVAFGKGEEIGVDVERRGRRVNPALVRRALCEEERALMKSDEDFLGFWVMKEAFLKRLGVGITRDLRGVDTSRLPDTTAVTRGDFLIGISGKGALEAKISDMTVNALLKRV